MDPTPLETHRSDRAPSPAMWWVAWALPVLGVCLVAPWVPHAFAVWDFGELLPLLRENDGIPGAIKALAEYYRSDGRANYLTYTQIAVTWGLAGDAPIGWQLQRALLMLLLGLGVVLVASRLGAPLIIAGLSGLLAILGASAMEGWSLLMGEPLATIFLLAMALLAIGYREASAWRGRAVALGILALAVMQTKEVLGLCIPPIVILCLCQDAEGRLRLPGWNRPTRWLLAVMVAALAVELAILLPALADLGDTGYALDYGREGFGVGRMARLALTMLLPTWYVGSTTGTLLYPSNLAAVVLLGAGAAVAWRTRRGGVPALVLLGALPLVGAAVYAPWPRYAPFYGMPFWLGGLALLVGSATVLARRSRGGAVLAGALLIGGAGFAAIAMDRALKERQAHADLAEQVVLALPGWPGVDSLFVVSSGSGARRWPVTGPELRRYAIALGADTKAVPPMVDITCEGAASRLTDGLARAALVNAIQSCGPLPLRTGAHVAAYRYRDWLSLRRVSDSVMVESLVPALVSRP